ncbi:MAG TPA: dipeptidase [Prolixibacteraceae bacterium]|nr:dipeptidase [Prolixibacteraceae bacterium]
MGRSYLLTAMIMASFLATLLLAGPGNVVAQTSKNLTPQRVQRVHEEALTVDTHCDTPMNILEGGLDIGKRNSTGKVDLPRMKEGGLDVMFFAIFTGQEKRTPASYEEVHRLAHRMTDSTLAAVRRYPELAEIALGSADAARIEKQGKRAIYLGMENGFPLGKEIRRVEEFYNKGIRYITLCHSKHNDICDSSSDRLPPEHNGLSPFGREVVMEMNRLGMIIDVSHISDKSFYDVVAISLAPVIASHSSVRAIAHHDRNMSDDMIKALARHGGVIQICLLDEYVKDPDPANPRTRLEREMRTRYEAIRDTLSEAGRLHFRKEWSALREKYPKDLPTVADYVDHIDHVVRLVGIDHVGIGSDFDGGGGLSGCNDVSAFPAITRELLARGYSEKEIRKIWGANFFRVFRKVEEVSQRISGAETLFRP